jgi:hypothetical protein
MMAIRFILLICLTLPILAPVNTWGKTVSLPIRIDYPMLRSLVAATAYTAPGERALVVDEAGGCRRVTLSEPNFIAENNRVRFTTRVTVRAGTRIGSRCVLPVTWDGYLVMYQEPVVDPLTWQLSFSVESSALQTLQGKPARVAGVVWDLIKARVYAYLERLSVDLSVPIIELKAFVHGLFAADAWELTRRLVDSMRPGKVAVGADGLSVPILADVRETTAPGVERDAEPRVELPGKLLVETWEAWDEFLVSMIAAMAPKPLTEAQRQVLLSVLLDMRHRFIRELRSPYAREDFVRRQFVDAWQQLSPLFREHLTEGSQRTLLGYLAFFSASDALAVLDAIGPELGIDISRGGLLRLIQLLSPGPDVGLAYGAEINSALRQALGLDELPGTPPGADIHGSGDLRYAPVTALDRLGRLLQRSCAKMIPSAWAGDSQAQAITEEMAAWVPASAGPENYRLRIQALLSEVVDNALAKSPLNAHFFDLCRNIMPALAWQESCMRQFKTTDDGRIVYLRSYDGSSVGIMQINERVWRGIYDLNRLRWEIRYNAAAGAEIMVLYFHRFLLPKAAKTVPDLVLDEPLLARVLYAMYNGGPGEFNGFLKRYDEGRLYLSDRLFYEKFEWVMAANWRQLIKCFGG